MTHVDFWPPGIRVNFVSKILKWLFGKFEGLINNFSLGRLSLVSLKLQQVSAYYLVFFRFTVLFLTVFTYLGPGVLFGRPIDRLGLSHVSFDEKMRRW